MRKEGSELSGEKGIRQVSRSARKPARYATSEAVDFLVIGSGAAGGIVAKELATAGFKVVVLEQGPYLKEENFRHDEIGSFWNRALTNDYRKQPNTFRKTAEETAKRHAAVNYGRMVGGGSVHFTGNYWRFHEIDFIERSKKGAIAGTGFADWPITYAELEPYYTKAEWELGISGQADANPLEPWHSKPYPLPPLPIKSSGVLMERAAKKLGWHAYPAPLAILSKRYNGRNACVHCGFCEYFGCEVKAKSSTLATVIPTAEATGRCEIRANSTVRRIATNAEGRATGAVYFNRAGQEKFQRARAVVLCANGAETPRLLLLSASSQFPLGLANTSGLVGKYLMFNSYAFCGGLFEKQLNEYKSVQVTRVVQDFYEIDAKHGFYGGGGLDTRLDLAPIGFALEGLGPQAPRWGVEYKKMLAETFTRSMYVLGHGTSLPVETNTITLDPMVRDAWGLPALRVTYKDHPDDLKTAQFFLDRGMELLDAAGALRKWPFPVEEQTWTNHLLGTCRMGNDPKSSVVDRNHRAHDVENLYIVDGSSFVTSGRGQPTCTIQALAYRAAEQIVQAARRGELKGS